MNTPNEFPDPLQLSLTAESADLPLRAAIEARRRNNERQRNHRRLQVASLFLLLAAFTWLALPWRNASHRSVSGSPTISDHESHATLRTAHSPEVGGGGNIPNQPIENPTGDKNQSLRTGLNPEQLALIKAAADQPMVLVKNSDGKVIRIHVIER